MHGNRVKMCNQEIKREAHLTIQSGPTIGMATLLAQQGTAMQKVVACRHHKGVQPHSPPRLSPPAATRHLLVPPPHRLHAGSYEIFSRTNHANAINRWGGLSHHTHHNSRASLPPLVSLYFQQCFGARQASLESLILQGQKLGMNNMKSSLMFFFSFYQYSYVMKLEQSSYVIHLAYETLCLTFHTMYMYRPRPKLRQ